MLLTMRHTNESFPKSIISSRCCSSRIEGSRVAKKTQPIVEPTFDDKFWEAKSSITCWADEVEAEEEAEQMPSTSAHAVDQQLTAVADQQNTQGTDEEEKDEDETERVGSRQAEEGQGSHEESAEGEPILFVGGLIFTDLEKATKDAGKAKLKELKDLRVKCVIEMLQSFGEIKLLKKRWDRRYCHVIFANAADTKRAYDCLTLAEERQTLKAVYQKKLQAEGLPIICAPSKYYVRWSTKEELVGKKGK